MSVKKPAPPKQKPRGHRPWFAFRRIDLEHEIDAIRRYIETVINALEREFQKYMAQLKKQMEEADHETMQQIGEAYAEEYPRVPATFSSAQQASSNYHLSVLGDAISIVYVG